jgi:hypothetical protein
MIRIGVHLKNQNIQKGLNIFKKDYFNLIKKLMILL